MLLSIIRIQNGRMSVVGDTTLDPTIYSFNIPSDSTTSAGVFRTNGTLVRTLWSNEKLSAGTYTKKFDVKDDFGVSLPDDVYIIRVLSNNFLYTWEGLIGNTSDNLTGLSKWRGFQGLFDMAVTGNTAYFCLNYSEGWNSNYKVNLLSPQSKTEMNRVVGSGNWGQSTQFVATDGTIVYWGGIVPDNSKDFIFGNNVSNDALTTFSSGVNVPSSFSKAYPSGIDVVAHTPTSVITGLAVQKTGTYLFSARGGLNKINILNKTTGALVSSATTLINPRAICIEGTDKLWVIHTYDGMPVVEKFSVNSGSGALTSTGLVISGLVNPLRLAVSPDNSLLLVIDGGSSQQIKSFNNSTGVVGWTLGQAGGYQSSSTVHDDKFYFVDRSGFTRNGFTTFIAFQQDGSFWVGDGGNYRVQHFSSSRTFIDSIMYYPHSYSANVDPNNPTRAFNGFMEYQIDYLKTLDNGVNGSWKLVRNWRDFGSPTPSDYHFESNIFKDLATLSNGRTYAFLSNSAAFRNDLFELSAGGNLRYTGINFSNNSNDRVSLMPDGSLRIFNWNGGQYGTFTWKTRTLIGFDGSNNPTWNTATTQMAFARKDNDPFPNFPNVPATSGGVLSMFGSERINDWRGVGYHLAGLKSGDTDWRFRTSPATYVEYKGDFPTDGALDVGNNVVYPAGSCWTSDNTILWNYHGEFWKNGQTNKWNQYHESGLMIGQFGYTRWDFPSASDSYYALAGNSFSGNTVKVNNACYLYFNEESAHSGLHRWKISNLDSLQIQDAVFPSSLPLPVDSFQNLMGGVPIYGLPFVSGTDGWTWDAISLGDSTIQVNNGNRVYKRGDHSIEIKYVKANSTFTISKDLGVINSANWEVKGLINFEGHTVAWNNNDNLYLEVVDTANKIILRIKFQMDSPVSTFPIDMYLNSTKVITEEREAMQVILKKDNILKITNNSVQFANYPLKSYSTPFTSGANMNAPAKLRVYFFNTVPQDNHYMQVALINFKIKSS